MLNLFFRVTADGNCLFHAVSTLLIGNECLCQSLRFLTARELHEHAEWYAYHSHFDNVAQISRNSSPNNLFVEAMTDIGCQKFTETKDRVISMKEEAIQVSHNFCWASYICIMAISSVIQVRSILCFTLSILCCCCYISPQMLSVKTGWKYKLSLLCILTSAMSKLTEFPAQILVDSHHINLTELWR